MITNHKKTLALLLPAHNEEVVISDTLESAMKAGMKREDIFVVDDASEDNTLLEVGKYLPLTNILKVEHSGKAGAIAKAIDYFEVEKKYRWIHIADADSIFARDYFMTYRGALSDKYVAAIGFVQSLKGNWLCSYRAISYTYGQHVIRRLQALFGMITVLPGPVAAFRTDILHKLDFHTGNMTEDFDLTLQIHRRKLGKIRFIPEAINYTQDPNNLEDYTNQTLRWYRGFFQGLRQYKIGLLPRKIDLAVHLILIDLLLFLFQLTLVTYILIFARDFTHILLHFVIIDIALTVFFITFAALITKRPRLMLGIF